MAIVQRVMRTVRGKAYEYYAVRFTDPGTGKGKTRYYSNRKLAEQARVELEGRVVGGTYSPDTHQITVRTIETSDSVESEEASVSDCLDGSPGRIIRAARSPFGSP